MSPFETQTGYRWIKERFFTQLTGLFDLYDFYVKLGDVISSAPINHDITFHSTFNNPVVVVGGLTLGERATEVKCVVSNINKTIYAMSILNKTIIYFSNSDH